MAGNCEGAGQKILFVTPDNETFEGTLVCMDATDDFTDSGEESFSIDTRFGSSTAYLATSGSILFFGRLGVGGFLARNALGPFAQKISLSPRIDPYVLGWEAAYHIEFIHVRGVFDLVGLAEQGKLTDWDEVGTALGRTYGVHDMGSVPTGMLALTAYGTTQALFQNYGTNALTYHLLTNGKLVNATDGVPVLGGTTRFFANQVESPFARKVWSGFLPPRANLSRGRAVLNLGMIGAGSYAGWFAMDYLKAKTDSERLDLYNETSSLVVDNYTETEFPGTLIGWSLGGTLGFGLGSAVGDATVNFVGEKVIPSGLYVYVNIPNGVVSQDVLLNLAERASAYSKAAGNVKGVIFSGMYDPSFQSLGVTWNNYYNNGIPTVDNHTDMSARGRFVAIVFESDKPDSDTGHVRWMRHYRPYLEAAIGDADNALRNSTATILASSRRLAGDSGNAQAYWDQMWENADTPEKKEAVVKRMVAAEKDFRKALKTAVEFTKFASDRLAEANKFSVHNYGSDVSINHSILHENGTFMDLGTRANATFALNHELDTALSGMSDPESVPVSLAVDERFAMAKARMQQATLVADRVLRSFGVDFLPDGSSNPFEAVARRMPELVAGALFPDLDAILKSYDERVARLRADVGDLENIDKMLDPARDQDRLERSKALYSEYDSINRERANLIKSTGSTAREIGDLSIKREAYAAEFHQLVNVEKMPDNSPRAMQLNAKINDIDAQLERLQHEVVVDGEVRKSSAPLFVQDGMGGWRSARIIEIEKRMSEIKTDLAKVGLTLESAEVVGRELRHSRRRLGRIKNQVEGIIAELDAAEAKARKLGCPEDVIERIRTTKEGWKAIDLRLAEIPETKLTRWDRFAMLFDKPVLRDIKPTTVGMEKARATRIRFGEFLGWSGNRGAGIIKYGSMILGNVVLGATFAIGGETFVENRVNFGDVEGTVDFSENNGPLFLFDPRNGGEQ